MKVIQKKIKLPEWKPDYGPVEFNLRSGASVIGVRDFLVAYNVNLNTTSVRRANAVAYDVRERGRVVKDENGNDVHVPGTLKSVKAIGWFIEEYGQAQVSINLTNINIAPVHIAFDEVCKSAQNRGMRVTGSELVGLIPLQSMLDAGKYFLKKQNRSIGVSESELIHIAVKSLGLDDLNEFHPDKKIIEYRMKNNSDNALQNLTLKAFADLTASESPAPGGGSISAYMGALGAALGTMVANLSAVKKGWELRINEFSDWAEKGQVIKDKLLRAVDEDTAAFNKIMAAFSLPKNSDTEKNVRKAAINMATIYAIEVPYKVMQLSFESMQLIKAMAESGNPNSVSDAGVGALCARSAVMGAHLNVKINASGLADKSSVSELLQDASMIEKEAIKLENDILGIVNKVIEKS